LSQALTLPFIREKTKQRYILLSLILFTVLGAALRLFQIGNKGLWLDEAFSVWMGWHPVSEMLSWVIRIDQHPPLYYFLLHLWIWQGDSAATVRSLSALFGLLTIPVVYLLGQRLLGWQVGLLAAFILTISPFHIRFAQETRMYTLLTLNASLAMLALAYLLTDPQAGRTRLGQQLYQFFKDKPQRSYKPLRFKTDLAWLGYIFLTTMTLLSHNTAIFFPVATNLFVLGLILFRQGQPPAEGQLLSPGLRNWLMAQLGILLLWSPWFVPFVIQSAGVYQEFWISAPDYKTVLWTISNLLSVFLPGQMPDRFEWTDLAWAVYGLIFLLGLWYLRRRPAHQALLLTLFLTPFVGEWLASLRRPVFYDRTLIWTSIPLYLLLAAGLSQLRYRPLLLAGVLFVVILNSLSLREYFFRFEKEQWNDAAVYVAGQVAPEDLLIFNATWVQIPFDFYFREFDLTIAKHGVPADLFERGVLEPKMTPADLPRLRNLTRNRARVWLIYSHNWYTDPDNLIPTALAEELTLLEKKEFYGLEVHLYGMP
jgi:uncharacterized membrane protein